MFVIFPFVQFWNMSWLMHSIRHRATQLMKSSTSVSPEMDSTQIYTGGRGHWGMSLFCTSWFHHCYQNCILTSIASENKWNRLEYSEQQGGSQRKPLCAGNSSRNIPEGTIRSVMALSEECLPKLNPMLPKHRRREIPSSNTSKKWHGNDFLI